MFIRGLLILCCWIFGFSINAQNTLSGKVVDAITNEPLIGAKISCGHKLATTDLDGNFLIACSDTNKLSITYPAYEQYDLSFNDNQHVVEYLIIKLQRSTDILKTTTVTNRRYEDILSNATVSMDVIQPTLVENINTVRLDNVVSKVPGVQMMDGQAIIRGGSGYSFGMGSRVMLLVDDIPSLQADAGIPNWIDIPIENIGQIEVIKGAASALYGSSALNGVINVRRARPQTIPETKVSLGYTYFMAPNDNSKKWWSEGDLIPHGTNANIVHHRRVGNLELTGSLFFRKLESYHQDTQADRNRLTLNARYKHNDKISYGLNTIINHSNSNSFFLWSNPDEGAYQAQSDDRITSDGKRFMIDPFLHIQDNYGGKHKLMGRYLYVDDNISMNQSSTSAMTYFEYQYQRRFTDQDLRLTGGFVYANTNAEVEVFGDSTFNNRNNAFYVQAEKKWGDLSLTVGGRYEYNRQESPENLMTQPLSDGIKSDSRPIFRAGMNYSVGEYSSLRASWGQGYRFPTINERYITNTYSGFSLLPNADLLPEKGWTAELGYKQGISALGFRGYIDIAGFWSEYMDMMEYTLIEMGQIGFQSQNIGDTRINGVEFSVFGQGKLGTIPINIFGGYTYTNPIYKEFTDQVRLSSSSDENILKYRSRHNYKLDVEGFYKSFSLGLALRAASHIEAIDAVWEELPGIDINSYRMQNDKGYQVFDIRMAYRVKELKFTTILANAFNAEYSLRPALLEAPRNLTVRLDYTLR